METSQQPLIFIVEDRPANIKVLSDCLKESGFKILVAKDGESALKKLEKISPDLILLDIMMPGIDGFETCRRLKALPATQEIPVIFMTALSDTVDKVKGLTIGGVDYITKPFQQEEVLARINVHLRLRKLTKQLQEAKQAAEAANRAKTEFLTNMSHELRTPLNAILGIAQILQGSKTMTTEELDQIHIIYQSGSHLLTLLNDVLDLSKIEAQKMELCLTDLSFSTFLKEIAEICNIWAQQKGIYFIYQPTSQLPPVIHADEKRLRQVLINLLGNAIKFTDKGGVIFKVVTADLSEDAVPRLSVPEETSPLTDKSSVTKSVARVRFQIEDTGIGMTSAELEKIFLPFEQAGHNRHKPEGTGLGLAITQKLLQMMGTTLKVSSKPGVGSVFWMDLDLSIATQLPETNKSELSSTSKPCQFDSQLAQQLPLRILLAEDNVVNQKVTLHLLKRLGYQADVAHNGQEVLVALRQQSYDVVLMDVQMPEMDGLEASRHICQEWPEPNRPCIIAITANAMEGDREKCLAAGMNDYISKPIRVEAVVEALRHCKNC
ncbi:MAG TPA: hybrid sensor histidine kinase/response regulator [Cyanobacteria bacterium UBA8803]|nr:hybrid sensor histidine kinase/response regulator [Cyanobacteria bacterium UBA9273]HBL60832.1 hybrid sensor histidine kinase/response regulator [Cyanobacteria bacterium UBA8803]